MDALNASVAWSMNQLHILPGLSFIIECMMFDEERVPFHFINGIEFMKIIRFLTFAWSMAVVARVILYMKLFHFATFEYLMPILGRDQHLCRTFSACSRQPFRLKSNGLCICVGVYESLLLRNYSHHRLRQVMWSDAFDLPKKRGLLDLELLGELHKRNQNRYQFFLTNIATFIDRRWAAVEIFYYFIPRYFFSPK